MDSFVADETARRLRAVRRPVACQSRFGEHQARTGSTRSATATRTGCIWTIGGASIPIATGSFTPLNQNLPLDQFITWQLAGDLLPHPTLEQHVATGFVRMNPTTAEGGVIPEEFQAKNNFDRVETLGTVLLGMSLTCARCHIHKYDPISQTGILPAAGLLQQHGRKSAGRQ